MVAILIPRSDILQCNSAYVNLKTCSSDLVWLCVIGLTIFFLLFCVERFYRLGKLIGTRLKLTRNIEQSISTQSHFAQGLRCSKHTVADEEEKQESVWRNSDPFLFVGKSFDHSRMLDSGMVDELQQPPVALVTASPLFKHHSVFERQPLEDDAPETDGENDFVFGTPRVSSTPYRSRLFPSISVQTFPDMSKCNLLSEYAMPNLPSPVHDVEKGTA